MRHGGVKELRKRSCIFSKQYLNCQQVKTEGQEPSGSLQLLPIPEWECEYTMVDLVVKLLQTVSGPNNIQMTVDRPIKSAYVLSVQ
jgi:hypothetical protein